MTLHVFSTMGLNGVLRALQPDHEAATGLALDILFEPTARLLDRIRGGERADLAILTADAVDRLTAAGVLERRTDLARSFVGVAVGQGAPHPDISTPDAFVATLLAARSVAMSQAGASGIFMAGLLERLGIADAIEPKSIILSSGYTASLLLSGEAELAIQQVSELMVVPGAEIVGRIPSALGGETMFSAAPFRDAARREPAATLIAALAAAERAELYRSCGLEPAGMAAPIRA